MIDPNSIATALTTVKTAVEIVGLLRQGDLSLKDAEQKMKFADLVGLLADLKTQLADVKLLALEKDEKIKELETQLALKAKILWERPFYWAINDGKRDGPFCSQCQDCSRVLVRLQDLRTGYWMCTNCKNTFEDPKNAHVQQTRTEADYDPYE
jgi:hypothetical protein